MLLKVTKRKTQQDNNLDEEVKYKNETKVHNSLQQQEYMILELQLVFLLYFLHVIFSYLIHLFLFSFQMGTERNKDRTKERKNEGSKERDK